MAFGIGIVGLGMVAATHVKALAELAPDIAIRGIFSLSARRHEFAARWSLPVANSLEDLLATPGVDSILVLTPPNARREIVAAAAAAGKHVLLEKPIERDSVGALEIVETCERAGVTLGVVFQHRFRAASAALKRLASIGELGSIEAVRVAVPWWRPQTYYDQPGRGTYARDGGGVLISQAIHTLDLMSWIAGPVLEVAAVTGTTGLHHMEAEDFVGAGLRFASGAFGSLIATTAAYPGGTESIEVTFERGAARLQGGVLTVTRMDGTVTEVGEPAGTGGGADPMAFPHAWHRDVIADFVGAVLAGLPPGVTGREALVVHRLIDALVASGRQRRTIALP